MQAQDLFPQVQRLVLAEQLTLLNFLVQLIQQEVLSPHPGNQEASGLGLAKPLRRQLSRLDATAFVIGGGLV